jgi:hypothetical protein
MNTMAVTKARSVLIASTVTFPFVVGYVSTFPSFGGDACIRPVEFNSNFSRRTLDAGNDSMVRAPEGSRPTTWEAAIVTELPLAPHDRQSQAVGGDPELTSRAVTRLMCQPPAVSTRYRARTARPAFELGQGATSLRPHWSESEERLR